MANQRKYSVRDFRLAIERAGNQVRAIAAELNCSTSTVYRWLRLHPELRDAHQKAGGEVEQRPRYYEAVKKAIEGSRGIYTTIANNAGVSRQTVVNYMRDYPELAQVAESERGELVDHAENALAMLVGNLDGPSVRFVLSTIGADRGYGTKTSVEISGLAISAETVALLEQLGKNPVEAVRQFEKMIEMQAERVASD